METIYTSTNSVGTMMKYRRGTAALSQRTLDENIGTCGALTAQWIRNMLEKPDLESTKPNASLSHIISAKSWILAGPGEQRTYSLLSDSGLKQMRFHTFFSLIHFLKFVRDNFGFYLVEMSEGHFIGAANLTMNAESPNYFLYDSNQALFKSTDGTDFYRTGSMKLAIPHLVDGHQNRWSINQEVWVSEVEAA